MNLDEYIKGVYDTSERFGLPHQLIIDLVDAQEVKRAIRNQPDDVYKSLETIKRYLQIQSRKYG